MSFEYYTTWWVKSRKDMGQMFVRDEDFANKFKPITDRNLANELIGGLYARYCMLVQDMCACVDQMAQPQKRIAVKKLVDSACIRLNELNDELRKIDISEYHYIDGKLIELKLIPYDVEILHPALFHHRPVDVEEFVKKIRNGERIFFPHVPTVAVDDDEENPEGESPDIAKGKTEEKSAPKIDAQQGRRMSRKSSEVQKPKRKIRNIGPTPVELTTEQQTELEKRENLKNKLILIQSAERARQCRVYFFEKMSLTLERKKHQTPGYKPPQAASIETREEASTIIQKVWRGYADREELRRKEEKRRFIIGMYEPSWKSRKEFEIFDANLEKRRAHRDERIKEYIEAIDHESARIFRVVAPGLLEDIEDEIREWFRIWYMGARTFDKFPPESKGGTILVIRGETMTPKEYLDDYEKKRRAKVKAGGKDAQKEKEKREKERQKKLEAEKKKKEAERKKKEAEAKKKKKKSGEFEYEEFPPTFSKTVRYEGEEEMQRVWDHRNDLENPEERHYMDIITEAKCHEVQLEVRRQADELMRLELDMLEEALAKDKGKKYKKKKEKKKKKRKGKKGKKDMTAERDIEELFQELVDNNIIRTYPKARLDDYHGDFAYNNENLRRLEFDPPASTLDVRQAVTLLCIQPLGVEVMKKPRSVLIAGPNNCGKHVLANAVFNHTNCVLFDLTPANTANKYPGAKGLAMLIHLVSKMAKILQPSVIFVDGAEKMFYKKVPKEEKDLDPKRVGTKFVKGIVKTIKADCRVLVLGITGAPWMGQAGKIKKAFDKVILIPRPDYGSVYLFWRELLMPYHAVDRNFNFSSLATVTKYYPYPVLKDVVEKVLTPRRIIQLKFNPLQPSELYEVFVANQIEPITDKEWKKWLKWYFKTPLGKQRNKFNKWADKKRKLEEKNAGKTRR